MDLGEDEDEDATVTAAAQLDPAADANTAALGSRKSKESMLPELPPDVEWWDQPYLASRSYDDVLDGTFVINGDKITQYIEHPVQIDPPVGCHHC